MKTRSTTRGRLLSMALSTALLGGGWSVSRAGEEGDGPGPAGLFETSKVWDLELELTPEAHEALEPPGRPGRGPRPGGPGFARRLDPSGMLAPLLLGEGDGDRDGDLDHGELLALGARWVETWDREKSGNLGEVAAGPGELSPRRPRIRNESPGAGGQAKRRRRGHGNRLPVRPRNPHVRWEEAFGDRHPLQGERHVSPVARLLEDLLQAGHEPFRQGPEARRHDEAQPPLERHGPELAQRGPLPRALPRCWSSRAPHELCPRPPRGTRQAREAIPRPLHDRRERGWQLLREGLRDARRRHLQAGDAGPLRGPRR